MPALLALLTAQLIKIILSWKKNKKFDIGPLFVSGGMPSSHTALVIALTTRVAIIEGIDSTFFAICAVFSLVVVYDAAGVRRSVGLQTQKLNQILDYFYQKRILNEEKLREVLGHTPMEVIGGIILGLLFGLLW